ncbi:putative acyl--CoA ligase YhfT [Aquimixticola soesokkakensis]|uniref:Putative acyl--CoA ligase YhfT n=1 Tax=Aquimixticola soesokkakensis TaxID=1519096 RepID=A0A1Y5TFR0_9RHOB|nr:AMP-binding protein [Aquimixticola soesokkakensis]SLN63033.1 putative acyl--CoA ligase YhfT [Aquimixticola soesokkakensis]
MTGPRFVWDPRAQLSVPAGGEHCARAVIAAIQAGADFAMSPQGVTRLPSARGVFHSRSGGTTGAPKTIARSHASWIASFEMSRAALAVAARDVYAVLSGPEHSLGLYALVEAGHLGADLHVLAGLRPRTQRAALAQAQVSVLYATPTQLRLLCDAGEGAIAAVRHVLCGGGKLPAGLRDAVARLFPNARLREFYGTSETSFIAWDAGGDVPEGAVGTAYPQVEIDIRRFDGTSGEIWVRSPYLFEGYAAGDSADTRWEGGFLSVGERGTLDAQGHLFVAGRQNRMVTIADQNVFPEDIEALVMGAGGVALCAAMPVTDTRRGTRLVLVVGGDAVDDAALLALCRARLHPLAVPRRVIRLSDFPQLASGKPDLRAIAERIA